MDLFFGGLDSPPTPSSPRSSRSASPSPPAASTPGAGSQEQLTFQWNGKRRRDGRRQRKKPPAYYGALPLSPA
ncbi:hypothetical protein D9613_004048 [Agrocybe pediades]|uniref:Uncharacterized protein n=1 Tax=Agrocybe pediades TaxID=84607 RepID=A0A8H4QJ65_9AGAR|nr:hypothetical protein D9613_004048 [Agrocybe pediades]